IRLADGSPASLSPDGKWILLTRAAGKRRSLVLVPTGAGAEKIVDTGPLVPEEASFLGAGRVLLMTYGQGGYRAFAVPLDGSPVPWPVGPAQQDVAIGSSDGAWAAVTAQGHLYIVPARGGEGREIAAYFAERRADDPIAFHPGGASLLSVELGPTARFYRTDLSTGARTLVR